MASTDPTRRLGRLTSPVIDREPRSSSTWQRSDTGEARMRRYSSEPRLGEVLADPVIQAVMMADHVDPEALRSSLMEMAGKMSRVSPGKSPEAGFWTPL